MMQKTIIITLIFIAFQNVLIAQRSISLDKTSAFELDLKELKSQETGILPFKDIHVYDYRFDSNKLGYYYFNSNADRIVFENNLNFNSGAGLNRYFKNNLDSSSKYSLAIILKSFWLQQGFLEGLDEGQVQNDYFFAAQDRYGICMVDLDVFLVTGTDYKALTKIEYEFALGSFKPKKIKQSFYTAFDSLYNKLAGIDIEKIIPTKRNFTWEEIHNNYSRRFNIPILSTSEKKKGVFLTFEDFKKNRVSYPDFTIRVDRLSDQLYTNNNASGQLLTEYWGFYDGNDYYLHIGLNFFKMIRQGNTFDLMGARNVSRQLQNFDSGYGRIFAQSLKVHLRPMQLDMDSGEVY